jgi:hypothetical protein
MPTISPESLSKTLDQLAERKKHYQGISEAVLEDLRRFCRANETCFNADPRIHAALEGRREVWLRIQQHLDLTPDQLLKLYSGGELSADMLEGTPYAR